MPTPLVALFYLWLVASVVVLVYRLATKSRGRPPVVRAADTDRALRTDWAPPPAAPTPSASNPSDPAPAPPPGRSPEPPVRPAPSGEAGPSEVAGSGAPATTLIEALAGISMPCDLLPLTMVEGRVLSDRELLLVTSGIAADEVGDAFATALEALGYSLTSMGPVTALATRGPDRVTVIVHERPFDELAGKRAAFPTTKPGDVVLELRL